MVSRKKVVLVIGMHRSGTSAITRSLRALGVELGDDHLPAASDNEKGFFEDRRLVEINARLMNSVGLSWDSIAPFNESDLLEDKLDDLRNEARAFLAEKMRASSVIGLKDPRLSRLLPFWIPLIEEYNTELNVVFPIRDPLAVASSLAKRNGFSIEKSLLLWLVYNLDALKFSEKSSCTLVQYQDLLKFPKSVISSLEAALGQSADPNEVAIYIKDFLDPRLDHSPNEISIEAPLQSILDLASTLFTEMSEGAVKKIDISEYLSRLDTMRDCPIENQSSDTGDLIGPNSSSRDEELQNYIQRWLDGDSVSKSLSDRIRERISDLIEVPTVNLAVFAGPESISKLRQTIKSCEHEQDLGIAFKITVFSDNELPSDVDEFDGAKFIFTQGRFNEQFARWIDGCNASDWILVLNAGEVFLPYCLSTLMLDLAKQPECRAVYCDEILSDDNNSLSMLLRPDISIDFLLSYPVAMVKHWLFRVSDIVQAMVPERLESNTIHLELALQFIEQFGLSGIGHQHVPLISGEADRAGQPAEQNSILRHLRNRGYDNADVFKLPGGIWGVDYGHSSKPKVSIIVPNRDRLASLQTCIESIIEKTAYPNYEILIVDNNSKKSETRAWLDGLNAMNLPNIRALYHYTTRESSELINLAVQESAGEYALILDGPLGITEPSWLNELINHGMRPEVGVVGPKVISASGEVLHSGMVIGMRGYAGPVCNGAKANDSGYMNRYIADQNYTAVSSSCMLVRKSVFVQIGGFDERMLPQKRAGLDFCIKASRAGLLTVWASRSLVVSIIPQDTNCEALAEIESLDEEQGDVMERWLPLMGNDPAFNRNLSLRTGTFQVDSRIDLSWQPQKSVGLPTVLIHPADQWGCGHYRMIQPLQSMKSDGIAGGMMAKNWLTIPELARLNPDVLVYQRIISEEAFRNIEAARRFFNKPLIYELDDYLPNLPIKSSYREVMPKDILKSLRKSLKLMDRFVVSTYPLAEAFEGLHSDIRVVENKLPPAWWGDLKSKRRQGARPRVGWAGGIGHTGDLELVEAVVRELSQEVEWVFFGMCPDKLRPYIAEFHSGVGIETYPAKLASMNLDLAIAPLEDNQFNRCKSNLRILEYGACGFPVVCSDVEAFRGKGLPVTRVRNRFKDWVEAIRMHLSDLDESARIGDQLRESVTRNWMLEGGNLRDWLDAWTKF